MIDGVPEVDSGQLPIGGDPAPLGLVPAPWSVAFAFALVALAFVLTLGAGALAVAVGATGWAPIVRALGIGGILLGLYVAILGVIWATSTTRGVGFAEAVGLERTVAPYWYAVAVGASLGGWLLSVAYTAMLTALGVKLPREDLALFRLMPGGAIGAAIMVALLIVVVPFAEEVVYRGVVLPAFGARWGTGAAVAVSALVFSAVHVSAVGFLPLLVVGAILGWLFVASRSLRVAILAHAVFNALGVAVLLASHASEIL